MRKILLALFGAAIVTFAVVPAKALPTSLSFVCVTPAMPTDCGTAVASAGVTLSASGSDVMLHLTLTGIGVFDALYIDDGAGVLSLLESISNGPDVLFSLGAPTPPDLPGGNNAIPPFNADVILSADANSPPSNNGVGNGEFLDAFFTLAPGKTFADVDTALAASTLRVGLHDITLPCEPPSTGCTASVSLVSGSSPPHFEIIEPRDVGFVGLSCVLLGSLVSIRRRRAQQA